MAEKGFFMDDWLKKFERYLIVERNGSEHTAAAYIRDIRQFFKLVFDDEEFSDYGAVDRDNARLLVIKLFDENVSANSSARKISSCRSFFRFASIRIPSRCFECVCGIQCCRNRLDPQD